MKVKLTAKFFDHIGVMRERGEIISLPDRVPPPKSALTEDGKKNAYEVWEALKKAGKLKKEEADDTLEAIKDLKTREEELAKREEELAKREAELAKKEK